MKTFTTTLFGIATLAVAVMGFTPAAKAGNPYVDGWQSGSISYDPFNDHTYIYNDRTRVRESAYDWNRGYMDPGSFKYVDRYFYDDYGRLVHEFGPTWTTYGKPHGELTRETVTTYYPGYGGDWCGTPGGGYTEHNNDTVIYLHNGGGVTEHNSDTVLYSKKFPSNGGVTKKTNDTVLFSKQMPPKMNNKFIVPPAKLSFKK